MTSTRITLTKKQLSTEDVMSLRALLVEVTKDGELSLGEIDTLKAWLAQRVDKCEVPAIHYLLEAVNAVILDGHVSSDDRLEIMVAIERVLPLPDRRQAKAARLNAQAKTAVAKEDGDNSEGEDDEDKESATQPQIAYIRALGGEVPANLGKWEASDLITQLKSRASSVSPRQMMVLRFWNKLELAKAGHARVSDWMDDWYKKDGLHLEAWELYKRESGDDGGQGDPDRVSIGAGYTYMKKLGGNRSANPFTEIRMSQAGNGLSKKWLLIILISLLVGYAAYRLRKILPEPLRGLLGVSRATDPHRAQARLIQTGSGVPSSVGIES